jgi:hypothetical protein
MKYQTLLSIAAGTMLILAIPTIWPYGYYEILRWVVSGVAVYSAFNAYEKEKFGWVFLMALIAIIFNPFAPIHLEKESWALVDFLAAIVMFVSTKKL